MRSVLKPSEASLSLPLSSIGSRFVLRGERGPGQQEKPGPFLALTMVVLVEPDNVTGFSVEISRLRISAMEVNVATKCTKEHHFIDFELLHCPERLFRKLTSECEGLTPRLKLPIRA